MTMDLYAFVLLLLFSSSSGNASAQLCGSRCESYNDCVENLVCTPNKVCDGDPAHTPDPCNCEAAKTFTYINATAHDPEYCVNGTTYQYFTCSPTVEARNLAALYFIELEGFSPACSGLNKTRTYNNSEHLASMATGWFQNHSSCFKEIVITSNQGRSVTATVVDQCSSTLGCVPETGYYEPCTPKSIGGTKGVWEALGEQENLDRVLSVTWSWKKDETGGETGRGRGRIISVAVTSCGIVVVLAALALLWWKFLRPRASYIIKKQQLMMDNLIEDMPRKMQYRELFRATKGFTNVVGAGGFGTVFKGMLANGEAVAVKRMVSDHIQSSSKGHSQFKAEVMSIGKVHHLNLVNLRGYCIQGPAALLVYEFMPNGSLDRWIFEQNDKDIVYVPLTWNQRHLIAVDVALALTYLHEGCRQQILHLDIKPQNILLDRNMRAKIADFGLCKLVERGKSQVVTMMRGTPGYMAPEWLHSEVTDKTDVYSFGIVLLELVSSKRAMQFQASSCQKFSASSSFVQPCIGFLGDIAQCLFHAGNILEFIDKKLFVEGEGSSGLEFEDAERYVKIGLLCIQEQPERRPTMKSVLSMLEGNVEVLDHVMLASPVPLKSRPPVSAFTF